MCLPFGPTTSSTSSSMSSASTPSPTPTLSASSPSFAAPTSSPSASCTRAGNTSSTLPCSPTCSSAPSSTVPMRSSCPRGLGWRLSRSQRERTRRGDRHLNFYGLRDNLSRGPSDSKRCAEASGPRRTSGGRQNDGAGRGGRRDTVAESDSTQRIIVSYHRGWSSDAALVGELIDEIELAAPGATVIGQDEYDVEA